MAVGELDGRAVGPALGTGDGGCEIVGNPVGIALGAAVGNAVGELDGSGVGRADGAPVGAAVGSGVGAVVGEAVAKQLVSLSGAVRKPSRQMQW